MHSLYLPWPPVLYVSGRREIGGRFISANINVVRKEIGEGKRVFELLAKTPIPVLGYRSARPDLSTRKRDLYLTDEKGDIGGGFI
jgi:hypothetical protein